MTARLIPFNFDAPVKQILGRGYIPNGVITPTCPPIARKRKSNRYSRQDPQQQAGITLIELILSIVILTIALTGIMSIMNVSVRHNADPLLQVQAIAIAESYLEEILLQAYTDPDGTNVGETRATYDNVADYHGLTNVGVRDQSDNAIASLSAYTVTVNVSAPVAFVGGVSALAVSVTVAKSGISNVTLVGYKFA